MRILTLPEIRQALDGLDLMTAIADGFVAYSRGEAVIPPVGELVMEDPPGDVHIKYGYLKRGDTYVVKIASGFYDNPRLGLPSSNGLMLLFDKATGVPRCVLLDEGHLTDIRTAVAGAVAARALAPPRVDRIGIVGTGIQARLQLRYLAPVAECRNVLVWGRSAERCAEYAAEMAEYGFSVDVASSPDEVAAGCSLIITTTPSTRPLIPGAALRSGTHITAVGSDSPSKRELDGATLARADLVVADSIAQCRERGEIHHGLADGFVDASAVAELGAVLVGTHPGRSNDDQITVADLTGVAVQDLQIANAVYEAAR